MFNCSVCWRANCTRIVAALAGSFPRSRLNNRFFASRARAPPDTPYAWATWTDIKTSIIVHWELFVKKEFRGQAPRISIENWNNVEWRRGIIIFNCYITLHNCPYTLIVSYYLIMNVCLLLILRMYFWREMYLFIVNVFWTILRNYLICTDSFVLFNSGEYLFIISLTTFIVSFLFIIFIIILFIVIITTLKVYFKKTCNT